MLLTHILQVHIQEAPQTNCHLTPELVREQELQLKDTYKRKSAYLNMITKTEQT